LRGCLFQFDSQGNGCHGSRSPVADHGAYRAPVAMRVDQWKRRWDRIEVAYERWEQRQLQHRFARWSRRRRIALFVLLPVVLICCGGLLAVPGAWFVRETAAAGEGAPSPEAAANDYLMRLSYNDAAGLLPLLADDQQDRLLDQWQAYRGAMQSTAPPPFKLDIGRLRSGSVVGGRIAVSTEVQAVWREQDENGRLGGSLDALSRRQDGKQAAANTIARKRAVFYGALRYAVELRLLPEHPMDNVQWVTPKSDDEVDRRSVVSPEQALSLLSVVADRHPRLLAFFACLYYAALRPAEALHLRIEDCELPEEGWGMLRLSGSTQHVGEGWGDDSTAVREDRELKHRAKKAVRPVPAAPPLVRALRWHIAEYGHAPDGRLFVTQGYGNGPVSKETYSRVWRAARRLGLPEDKQRTPLAKRPYELRHAAVSLWLNQGVPATQVAEWAGHSVHVLLKVYAKCIDGQDEMARRRIDDALGMDGDQGERGDSVAA
jgi:integrase